MLLMAENSGKREMPLSGGSWKVTKLPTAGKDEMIASSLAIDGAKAGFKPAEVREVLKASGVNKKSGEVDMSEAADKAQDYRGDSDDLIDALGESVEVFGASAVKKALKKSPMVKSPKK